MEELITTKEAAEMAGVKQVTIRSWRVRGKITPVYGSQGAKLMFRKTDIENLLQMRNKHV